MLLNHPTLEELKEFVLATSRSISQTHTTQVLRHLLADCSVCRERLGTTSRISRHIAHLIHPKLEGFAGRETANENDYNYSTAFAGAEQAVSAFLAPDSPGAESPDTALAELETLAANEQARSVRAGGIFANPAVISALINRSHEIRYQDAEKMLSFANLARLAADAGSADSVESELRLADLRARAWGQYGNALRVSGKPRESEEALATAQRHRNAGTGDPMLRAWLLERQAPLAIFQGRFDDAIEICDEAGEIYRELDESHLLARTKVQKAIATLFSGEAESAVRILNQAIPLIDPEEDPHLLLAACHNLIHCYIDLDRPEQALQLYSETRELFQEFEDPLISLRATWQEGQLLRDLGQLQAAETALLRARKGYMERKLAYEAALVSLDLATVYVKLGLVDKLKRTVLETVPIFHALRVGLETLASLLQLQKVADQEQQALDLIHNLSSRIEPLRRHRIEES
jgi:tetratricopeptide (TPR) repeat protein